MTALRQPVARTLLHLWLLAGIVLIDGTWLAVVAVRVVLGVPMLLWRWARDIGRHLLPITPDETWEHPLGADVRWIAAVSRRHRIPEVERVYSQRIAPELSAFEVLSCSGASERVESRDHWLNRISVLLELADLHIFLLQEQNANTLIEVMISRNLTTVRRQRYNSGMDAIRASIPRAAMGEDGRGVVDEETEALLWRTTQELLRPYRLLICPSWVHLLVPARRNETRLVLGPRTDPERAHRRLRLALADAFRSRRASMRRWEEAMRWFVDVGEAKAWMGSTLRGLAGIARSFSAETGESAWPEPPASDPVLRVPRFQSRTRELLVLHGLLSGKHPDAGSIWGIAGALSKSMFSSLPYEGFFSMKEGEEFRELPVRVMRWVLLPAAVCLRWQQFTVRSSARTGS